MWLNILRVAFGVSLAIVWAAYFLPEILSDHGFDILPLKWATIFYGMIAILGSIVLGPVWLAVEIARFFHRRGRQSNA